MEAIADAGGDQLNKPWPGVEVKPANGQDGNPFKALLGTPHGQGVARLLTHHATDLPGKNIESITSLTTSRGESRTYHFLFKLTE